MLRRNPDQCRIRRQQLVTVSVLIAGLASGAPYHLRLANAAEGPTIYVTDVNELYAAVNEPANAGAAVTLAPGVYTLSTVASPSTAGRVQLQRNMSLYGVKGHPDAVVIDASLLPASAFTFNFQFGRTGVIRIGRGNSSIEWLTIAGNDDAAAAIETDLVETDKTTGRPLPIAVRVAHVLAGDSARGVDIRNVGPAMAGRQITADIVDNEFFRGVEGIRVINFMGAHGGEITVAMRGNRSYENVLGCIFENNRSNSASIYVRSSGDRFEDNGLGCQIGGGLVGTATGMSNDNSTTFEAHATQFTRNTRIQFFNNTGPPFDDWGGLFISGGEVIPAGIPYTASRNNVVVRLWGCKVAENVIEGRQDFELRAFGAHSTVSGPAGRNNQTLVELHGVSKFVEVFAVDSEPPEPSGTNTVTVVRNP